MKKLLLVAVLLLAVNAAWAVLPQVKTEVDPSNPAAPASKAAMWDSLSIFTAAGTVRCAAIGDGDNDTDTLETFIGMSAAPRDLRMITPLTATTQRSDLIISTPANRGVQCVAVGNCDSFPGNEVVFGTQQAAASYRSLVGMAKWNGASWTTTYLDSSYLSGTASYEQVNAIKVGDVNGDGINEIVYALNDTIKMMRYNASTGLFDKSIVYAGWMGGSGGQIYYLDIGDFDPDHAGIEIAFVNNYGLVTEVYWNGSGWSSVNMYAPGIGTMAFNFVTIGDFDPDHAGNEVAFARFSAPTTEIYETYGGSAGTWTTTKLFTSAAGAQASGLASGNFDAAHAGNELAYAQYGTKQVIELKKTAGTWYSEVAFTGGAEMTDWWGLAGGNANPYHAGDELVACNSAGTTRRALRIQDRVVSIDFATLSVTNGAPYVAKGSLVSLGATMINNSTSAGKAYFATTVTPPSGTSWLAQHDSSAAALNPDERYQYFGGSVTADTIGRWAYAESLEVAGDSLPGNNKRTTYFHSADTLVLPFAESFDVSLLPSVNWDTVTIAAGATAPVWSRVTTGTTPTCAVHSGAGMAKFNSYDASSGGQERLVLFPAKINTPGVALGFWMYNYTSGSDSMLVDVSTDNGQTWTKIAGYPLLGTAGWSQKTVNLTPYNGMTIVLAVRGRSAYGNNIFIDDVTLTPPLAHDFAVARIVAPAAKQLPAGVPFSARAVFANNGATSEGTYVYAQVKDNTGASLYLDSVSMFLNAFDSTAVNFAAYTPTVLGTDTMVFYAALAGDLAPANDRLTKTITIVPIHNMTMREGFENATFPPADWDTLRYAGTTGTWSRVTAGTNPTCAPLLGAGMGQYNSYSATAGNQMMLLTPFLNVNSGGAVLRFAMYGDSVYATYADSVLVDVSTDQGVTWNRGIAGYDRRTPHVNSWNQYSLPLVAYQGAAVRFALRAKSAYGDNMFVDDVRIGVPPSVAFTPANGATSVAVDAPLFVAFTNPMDTVSVVYTFSDAPLITSHAWSATLDTLTLTHTDFKSSGSYTLAVSAGADTFGLPLANPGSAAFTAADIVNPELSFVVEPSSTYDTLGPYVVRAVLIDSLKAKAGIGADSLYYQVGDMPWTGIGHSAVSGDTFNYEIPGPVAKGTQVSYQLVVIDNGGNFNLSGVGTFTVLNPIAPYGMGRLALTTPFRVGLSWSPPTQEIDYTDATPYWLWYGDPGDLQAVRFSPQYTPCKLTSAKFLFYNTAGNVQVHVWSDSNGIPGHDLMTPVTVAISQFYPNWTTVNLSAANITVNGDYHIGFNYLAGGKPRILADTMEYTGRSQYIYLASTGPDTAWTPDAYWGGGDWFINSVVVYGPGAKAYASRTPARRITARHTTKHAEVVQGLAKLNATKNITSYTVERDSAATGWGDWRTGLDVLGYEDSTLVEYTNYDYRVKVLYNGPDTAAYTGTVSVYADFTGPDGIHTTPADDDTAGTYVTSLDLIDSSGIYRDSIYYWQPPTAGSPAIATHDSVTGGNHYWYHIVTATRDSVFYQFVAYDNSFWHNRGNSPVMSFRTNVGVSGQPVNAPVPFYLGSVAPNPVSGNHARFEFGLPAASQVSLEIYNVIGQKVATLVNGKLGAGRHNVSWTGLDNNGRRVSSGLFIYRLTADGKVATKKLTVIR